MEVKSTPRNYASISVGCHSSGNYEGKRGIKVTKCPPERGEKCVGSDKTICQYDKMY